MSGKADLDNQSKVSKVLNRKRPLNLSMIRALHHSLGIPPEVLLQEPGGVIKDQEYKYRDYPFAEMVRRGYFSGFHGSLSQARDQAEDLLAMLFSSFGKKTPQLINYHN